MKDISEGSMSIMPGGEQAEAEFPLACADCQRGTQELRDFKNVTNNLMQDALNVWSELWAEIERQTPPDSEASGGKSERLCDCREFLTNMWTLRHYLDFTRRLSR